MKILQLTLFAQEPLVITDGSAESMAHQTLDYVPGNMLLGAMAKQWITQHPNVDPDADAHFRALFLDGTVEWGHAVPLVGEIGCVPIPLCLHRIKNRNSLPFEGESGDGCGVLNMLHILPEENLREMLEAHGLCGMEEDVKLKKMPTGFMEPQCMRLPTVRKVWAMHVALGSARRALQGQLFGYSAMAATTRLRSQVRCHSSEAVQALQDLLGKTSNLCVGHARSAGYGRVDISTTWIDAPHEQQEIRGTNMTVFLHADYMPSPSWRTPVESLLDELQAFTGKRPKALSVHGQHIDIQGFNALWGRPRTSRTALSKGSVLRLCFDAEVALPRFMTLGADKREGYGRMEWEPAFLTQTVLRPQDLAQPQQDTAMLTAFPTGPVWLLLRKRALQRQIDVQVSEWLARQEWRRFLESVSTSPRPTQSQRGNIRRIMSEGAANPHECFKTMLEKTPGKQWKNAICDSPFSSRKEHLDGVMLLILERKLFLEKCPPLVPTLLGDPLSAEEQKQYNTEAHRRFVLRLLGTWEKLYRIKARRMES